MNAGADVGHAQMDAGAAVRLDRDRRAGFAGARRPFVNRHAASDIFCFRFLPAGGVERFLEDFFDDDAFQFLTERCRVAIVEQVLHAKFDRVQTQLARDDIDLRFHRKSCLRAAWRARLRARNLVGVDAKGFDLNRRDAVIAGRTRAVLAL